jgi:hypothetical protein
MAGRSVPSTVLDKVSMRSRAQDAASSRMIRTRRMAGALAALALAAPASGSRAADEAAGACPGASAWRAAHPEQAFAAMKARDAARSLGSPDVLAELRRRVDADQAARRAMLASPGDAAAARAVNRIDDDDVAWLTRLLKKDGFPRIDQVGEVGLHLMWVLVQHADRDPPLQRLALVAFGRLHADGEFSGEDLARLTDRVLVNQGRPQRYGTQFDWASGHFDPKPIADPQGVDERRGALGLMPLADYACAMDAALERDSAP